MGSPPAADTAATVTPLWEGDTGTLPVEARQCLVALLSGHLSREKSRDLFRVACAMQRQLASALDNLFLRLVIDEDAGVAYTKPWDANVDGIRTLLRTVRLKFVDSVLLLHLRHVIVSTPADQRPMISPSEAFAAIDPYIQVQATDKTASRKRFDAAWTRAKEWSFLIKGDVDDRFEIAPILRFVFTVDEINAVAASYEQLLVDQGIDPPRVLRAEPRADNTAPPKDTAADDTAAVDERSSTAPSTAGLSDRGAQQPAPVTTPDLFSDVDDPGSDRP